MIISIYKLTCLITNMSYIGQTKNSVKRRIYYHIIANSYISNVIHKYELKNFKLEILWITANRKTADCIEKAAINFYNTRIPNGYNVLEGGFNGGIPLGNTNMKGKKNPAVSESNRQRKGEKRPKVSEFMKNNNPMKRPEIAAKFKGKNNPAHRLDVKYKKLRTRLAKLEMELK